MTTKLPFLFGGDFTLLLGPNTYYVYNSAPSISPSSNLATISANLSLARNSTNVSKVMNSAHQTFHQLIQQPLESKRLDHLYGVLAALSSLIFASAVFIFIRKAKGSFFVIIISFMIL